MVDYIPPGEAGDDMTLKAGVSASFMAYEDHSGLGMLQIRLPFMGQVSGKFSLDLEGDFEETNKEAKAEIERAMQQCMGVVLSLVLGTHAYSVVNSEAEAHKLFQGIQDKLAQKKASQSKKPKEPGHGH